MLDNPSDYQVAAPNYFVFVCLFVVVVVVVVCLFFVYCELLYHILLRE